MALVTTPGAANANSFVSVAAALTYQVGHPGAADFAALSTADKEALLIWATQDISLGFTWDGTMVSATQALPFPMQGQTDAYGRVLATNIIPPLVEQATALYALTLMQFVTETESMTSAGQTIQRLRKGTTEVWYSSGGSSTTATTTEPVFSPNVVRLLQYYGRKPSRVCVPLVRV
jgi:hypothetical protein